MGKRNGIKKMPLSRIKDMVKYGNATRVPSENDVPRPCAQIAYSVGTNGVNGYLFKSDDNKYYAVVGR